MSQALHAKLRYRTIYCKPYNAARKSRGSLAIWLDKGMSWFAAGSGKYGRSPQFSDAAIPFCLSIKNLFGLALRQTTGFVPSLLAVMACSGLQYVMAQTTQSGCASHLSAQFRWTEFAT